MTTFGARQPNFEGVDGHELLGLAEVILKGVLESELPIHEIVAARRGAMSPLFDLAADERVARLMIDHDLIATPCADAARSIALGRQAAAGGRRAVVFIDSGGLDGAIAALRRIGASLEGDGGAESDGGMTVIVVDQPAEPTEACPRAALRCLGAPTVEPADLAGARDAIEQAARLGRAARRIAGIVLHESLLRAADTLESRPNRVVPAADVLEAARHRRRRPRPGEALDLLRMIRRLEINTLEGTPSPGERAETALIGVGPSRIAIRHVLDELRLGGRLPVLNLGVVHPLDEAVLERVLSRATDVLVLEPAPGSVGVEIAAVAERLARRGVECGHVWWESVPPAADGAPEPLGPDDSVDASALARRTLHLLHGVRPGLKVASRLASADVEPIELPPRNAGDVDAVAVVHDALAQLDRWARGREEPEFQSAAVMIDGRETGELPERVLRAECWDRRRFSIEGSGAVRQAARERRPRLFIVVDVGGEDEPDPERLARGTAPGERSEPVRIESVRLVDRTELRDRLRSAVDFDGLTVLVVRTNELTEPARRAAEVDRFGYQPSQRLVWAAELACDLRPTLPRTVAEAGGARALVPFDHQTRVDRVSSRRGASVRLRPTLEQIEVVRTRAPTPGGRIEQARLAPPRPLHGAQGIWRCHLAGIRGRDHGFAADVLLEAGRLMGYHVRAVHDPEPIGPRRGAWAQVLFTKPRAEERAPTLTAQIPWGEADLLIGADPVETLRAVGGDARLRVAAPDRTHAVVNSGLLDDQFDQFDPLRRGFEPVIGVLAERIAGRCLADRIVIDDVAAFCRAWFRTDRVIDLVMLGMAYQRGAIPISPDAATGALRRAESRGAGRATEAFAMGRQFAAGDRPLRRVEEQAETAERAVRRLALDRRRGRTLERRRLEGIPDLAMATLARTPGLAETVGGKEARTDLVAGLRRCAAWGGATYARRYADAIVRLYDADRGDCRRELTRLAIVPLAEAMLPRDSLYLAMMATSAEHRRRIRQRLGVRTSRGDQLQRRYLNRLDLRAFGWRVRIDFRTSDWPARLVAMATPFVPLGRRGSANDRAVRAYVLELVERATEGSAMSYRHWSTVLRRLAEEAAQGRLRGVAVDVLRSRVERDGSPVVES